MSSRKYNRRVALQVPTRTPNGKGGYTKSWADAVPIWAQLIPLRGGEALEHQVLNAKQLWRVTIRHRDDVTEDCRLIWNGREFNIQSCEDPDGRRREIVMTCETGTMT